MPDPTNEIILRAMARIEEKLDLLLSALAEDEPEYENLLTLDGEAAGEPRDPTEPL